MKYLKNTSRDLRELYERSISVRTIAEPFLSIDADTSCDVARELMQTHDYDVIGVRRDGYIIGYIEQVALADGLVGDHYQQFSPDALLLDTSSLLNVLAVLADSPRAFILFLGAVGGIVTRGDLQKSPVRMWLFGLISLLEMQLLRIVREYYPQDSWRAELTPSRLALAQRVYDDRLARNEGIGLDECLQVADKLMLVYRHVDVRAQLKLDELGITSRQQYEQQLSKNIDTLRNKLAHAQDLRMGDWQETIRLALKIESFLQRCEEIEHP